MDAPLLRTVDAVTLAVPDLDAGLAFYVDALGHELLWRNDAVGQAGLRCPDGSTARRRSCWRRRCPPSRTGSSTPRRTRRPRSPQPAGGTSKPPPTIPGGAGAGGGAPSA